VIAVPGSKLLRCSSRDPHHRKTSFNRDGKTGYNRPPPRPPCSVVHHVLVTVRAPARSAVIKALVQQDVGIPQSWPQ
jgi:hypothetical protein